jgi:hypothetical protein
MENQAKADQVKPSTIRSGAEVVADFIDEMKKVTDLDQPTIHAIEELWQTKKFTWVNLEQKLEEARKQSKL